MIVSKIHGIRRALCMPPCNLTVIKTPVKVNSDLVTDLLMAKSLGN